MLKTDKLFDEIDSLPLDIKTDIVERILKSINPTKKNIDNLWANEAESRVKEIKNGKISTIPGNQVFNELKNRFKK